MANNTGVTLAKIRAGTASFKEDNTTCSDEIKAVQKALKLIGFWGSPSAPDGIYGAYSVAAVKGFQCETGLTISGNFDKNTLTKLESFFSFSLYAGHSNTPSWLAIASGYDYAGQGSSGSAVAEIRSQLIKKGYSVATSGSFDATLTSVVKQFQKNYGLDQDGSVGQKTYCVLVGNATSTNWFEKIKDDTGKITLTPDHLARCGFSGVLLNLGVSDLNIALNKYNINTKQKVRHFLAQCMYETEKGTQFVEYGYQAGRGKVAGVSYSPYYGSGCLHLSREAGYKGFYDYMKEIGVTDEKIYIPAAYATQHVAFKYPGRSAGWYWEEGRELNNNNNVDWSKSASDICTTLTGLIVGSESSAPTRLGYYNKISTVLK